MHRLIHPLVLLLLAGLVTGCAMDKKDCQNADWHAYGYNDGIHGRPAGQLNVYNQRCGEFKITPDANAYQAGWDQGIHNYCTGANGFNAGAAGYAYNNVCPPDVAPNYLAGYRQGLDQYCSPDNGLRLGISGGVYRGVCPADMANAFLDRYRLGRDLHHARDEHRDVENRVDGVRQALAATKDPKAYHDLLEQLSQLRHEDERSEATLAALNACADNDWFQAGLSDGENGLAYRAGDIANLCGSYGSSADPGGYREGWQRGNAHYCSYDSGVYAGQAGLDYHNVCRGPSYLLFWGGYMQGLGMFRAGRYENHPRPTYPHAERRRPEERMPVPERRVRQPEQPRQRTIQSGLEYRRMNPPAQMNHQPQPTRTMQHQAASPTQPVAAPQPGQMKRRQEAKPQQAAHEQKGEATAQQPKQQNGQPKAKTKRREPRKARRRMHSED